MDDVQVKLQKLAALGGEEEGMGEEEGVTGKGKGAEPQAAAAEKIKGLSLSVSARMKSSRSNSP